MSSISANGMEMSVTDENGMVYTLNALQNEVRRSDGVVLVLTPEVTAQVATVFEQTIVNDPSIHAMQNPDAGSPDQCTGTAGDPCAASVGGGFEQIELAGGGMTITRAAYDPFAPTFPVARTGAVSLGDYDTVFSMFGDKCTDIINAALPKTYEYGGARTGFFSNLLGLGASALVAMGFNETALRLELPKGTVALTTFAVALDLEAARVMGANVAIGFFRGLWNSYGCSQRGVTAGPYYSDGTGTLSQMATIGYNYVCHTETWTIEWSSGSKEKINVSVCQFEM